MRTDHPFQVHVGYNRSPSRGTVTPTAPLPPAAATAPVPPPPPPRPRVRFNYMSEEEDWRGFRAAVRISHEIVPTQGLTLTQTLTRTPTLTRCVSPARSCTSRPSTG